MLTKLIIRNFKLFGSAEIELGSPVVFIGPNNSGKTTALQALALWDIGLKRWIEKKGIKEVPKKRPGVTINRRDLMAVPIPSANLLWRDLHTRDVRRLDGKQDTQNVRIEIIVEGVAQGKHWSCGLEFDYANEQSFFCRPLRLSEEKNPDRMPVPEEASDVRVAFLPPMSGLADQEFVKQTGEINFLVGQGRTAEVLRNLCLQVRNSDDGAVEWNNLCERIKDLFGVSLDEPVFIKERGEITLTYRDQSKTRLDLSSAGRGLHQTLLLLAYLTANRGSVLLLDEPDAHLEILRQRQIYELLSRTAREHGSQIIAASHSEVVLNEAADRDVVVAFVGKPHRIDDRSSQVLKALKEIGFDQYYQAEQTGWVLYVEGSTDLSILKAFAQMLDHPVAKELDKAFVRYVGNQPQKARDHFNGLREAKKDLAGFALFDRLEKELQSGSPLYERMWSKREVENYLCSRDGLLNWAQHAGKEYGPPGPLFARDWKEVMSDCITSVEQALSTLGRSPWSDDTKVSDDFLPPLFENFFEKLALPNLMNKSDYHALTRFVPIGEIDPEVGVVLDMILEKARLAKPRGTLD